MKRENVGSADKKPERYTGPDGKPKIRMVPVDKDIVKEILDTPKAMDSYKNKAKYSKDKAARSAVATTLRSKDKAQRDHPAKDLKTMSKRTKGLKMADRNAVNKTFRALRKEGADLDESNLKLVNRIKRSGVVKSGSMAKDAPIKKEDLEQDGPRRPNTPDGLSKNFGKMYGKKASAYLKKKVDQRNADHAKQDPKMVKKGYGPAVLDREKAQAKRAKRMKKLGEI
jgi:hypothetical protein